MRYLNGNLSDTVEVVGIVTREPGHVGWWTRLGEPDAWDIAADLNIPRVQLEDVKDLNIDRLFSILYWKHIPGKILDQTRHPSLNLHLAPLPRYRGCNVYSHAIINGESDYGVTIQEMESRIDTGAIVATSMFPLDNTMTAFDLNTRAEQAAEELFKEKIGSALAGGYEPISQADLLAKNGSTVYDYPRNSLEGIKDLTGMIGTPELDLYVRGLEFPPYEPGFIQANGKKIYLTSQQPFAG